MVECFHAPIYSSEFVNAVHFSPPQAMLSLNRHDRLRLINFGSDARAAVRIAILNFYQTKEPEERKYYGAFEYKVVQS